MINTSLCQDLQLAEHPEPKRALAEFQKTNGLKRTTTLDQQTADALIGNNGIGQGSSLPPKSAAESMTNSSGTSDFGSHTGQQ